MINFKTYLIMYHSPRSILMTSKTPSGVKLHRKSIKPGPQIALICVLPLDTLCMTLSWWFLRNTFERSLRGDSNHQVKKTSGLFAVPLCYIPSRKALSNSQVSQLRDCWGRTSTVHGEVESWLCHPTWTWCLKWCLGQWFFPTFLALYLCAIIWHGFELITLEQK